MVVIVVAGPWLQHLLLSLSHDGRSVVLGFVALGRGAEGSDTVCSFTKKPIFIGFFEHPSKASRNIMQQQSPTPSTPLRKSAPPIFRKPLF